MNDRRLCHARPTLAPRTPCSVSFPAPSPARRTWERSRWRDDRGPAIDRGARRMTSKTRPTSAVPAAASTSRTTTTCVAAPDLFNLHLPRATSAAAHPRDLDRAVDVRAAPDDDGLRLPPTASACGAAADAGLRAVRRRRFATTVGVAGAVLVALLIGCPSRRFRTPPPGRSVPRQRGSGGGPWGHRRPKPRSSCAEPRCPPSTADAAAAVRGRSSRSDLRASAPSSTGCSPSPSARSCSSSPSSLSRCADSAVRGNPARRKSCSALVRAVRKGRAAVNARRRAAAGAVHRGSTRHEVQAGAGALSRQPRRWTVVAAPGRRRYGEGQGEGGGGRGGARRGGVGGGERGEEEEPTPPPPSSLVRRVSQRV